jgi:hypothetical protein
MPDAVAQRTMHVSLDWLVDMAERGLVRPAQFSRPQVWTPANIIDLFDSIYRNYPIGTLLAIEKSVPEEDVLLGNTVIHAPSDLHALILVDGVQRVSAIVGALSQITNQQSELRFRLYYDIKTDNFTSDANADSFLLPVSEIFRSGFTQWLHDHPFLNEADIDACWRVRDAFKGYQIPITVVSGPSAWETAQVIFTRINTSGVNLSRSDLERAKLGRSPLPSGPLEEFVAESERGGFGRLQPDLAAQCILALTRFDQQGLETPPGWTRPTHNLALISDSSQREAGSRALEALIPGIQFLREFAGIPHSRLLPYPSILVNLVRFIDRYGPPAGRAAELLRRWIWRSTSAQSDVTALNESPDIFLSSPSNAAERLLDTVSSAAKFPGQPNIEVADLNHLNGRINALALLSLRPPLLVPLVERDNNSDRKAREEDATVLTPGVSIASPQILIPWLNDAVSAFAILLPWRYTDSKPNTLGSYLLHPAVDQQLLIDAAIANRNADDESLNRHLIDNKARTLLQHGRFDEFVDYRNHQIADTIRNRVQSMARWGFRDHGELPRIPDDGEYSDRYSDEY